jgi:hypothetical protein
MPGNTDVRGGAGSMTEPAYTAVKDSGKRQEFGTGAVRDLQEGKGRYDCISPWALERLAKHMENGARKYGIDNWTHGMPQRRFMDSALRHLNLWRQGDRSEDHLAACLFNVFALIDQERRLATGELPADLDDCHTFDAKQS